MPEQKFDKAFWEQLWLKVLREQPEKVTSRPPSPYLEAELAGLEPGRALDAGCGHGADTLWLAAHGWHVTAVDFSRTALVHARSIAEAAGSELAKRIDWVETDLQKWTPPKSHYDLVISLYVHADTSVDDMVRRLADGVAPGGTLFLAGHRPIDPSTGAPTAAADQLQVSVEAVAAVLDSGLWELIVAEERSRAVAGSGVDAVIRARRRS